MRALPDALKTIGYQGMELAPASRSQSSVFICGKRDSQKK